MRPFRTITDFFAAMRARPELRRKVLRASVGIAVVLLCALIYKLAIRAELRIVNTHDEELTLFLDGTKRTLLPTVQAETPDAGVLLRLSPGKHHFRTETPGGLVVDDLDIHLEPSTTYLVAPGHTEQCFFLEHTAYGEAKPIRAALTELPRDERIWPMPEIVDAWFVPNPQASTSDKRSSGGVRTAVRQTRCGFTPWK